MHKVLYNAAEASAMINSSKFGQLCRTMMRLDETLIERSDLSPFNIADITCQIQYLRLAAIGERVKTIDHFLSYHCRK